MIAVPSEEDQESFCEVLTLGKAQIKAEIKHNSIFTHVCYLQIERIATVSRSHELTLQDKFTDCQIY